jgi:hypothetical protein
VEPGRRDSFDELRNGDEALAKNSQLLVQSSGMAFLGDARGACPAATARRVLSPQDCGGYEARRRWAGRFAGVGSGSALVVGTAFARAFRSRLALRVATRSVVGGRASTSTRWIS